MFNVSERLMNMPHSQLSNRLQSQQLNDGLRFETIRSICAALHEGGTSHTSNEGHVVFYYKKSFQNYLKCLKKYPS